MQCGLTSGTNKWLRSILSLKFYSSSGIYKEPPGQSLTFLPVQSLFHQLVSRFIHEMMPGSLSFHSGAVQSHHHALPLCKHWQKCVSWNNYTVVWNIYIHVILELLEFLMFCRIRTCRAKLLKHITTISTFVSWERRDQVIMSVFRGCFQKFTEENPEITI